MATSHAAVAIYEHAISRVFSANERIKSAAVRATCRFLTVGQLAAHYAAEVNKEASY